MNTRQIVLDTETTGLDTREGHRIIEIGCVEIINRRPSQNSFHQYVNPDREIDEGAISVHGITNDFLQDKPRFADIVRDLLEFIRGAELIIHNASFDVGFINYELQRLGGELGELEEYCTVLDTLHLARQNHPGQRNDLDALCRRYEIDNTQRNLHGALLDAEILADVYLAMTGGQAALLLDELDGGTTSVRVRQPARNRAELRIVKASPEELQAHEAWLDMLDEKSGGKCLWRAPDETEKSGGNP